jgi:hypothetical protein
MTATDHRGLKIGFTGARMGMSVNQILEVTELLSIYRVVELHHGDCVGADAEVHAIAKGMDIYVVVHPPLDPKHRAWCEGDEMRDELPYIERNHNIVDETQRLIVAPRTDHEIRRSGTWATYRYAKDQAKVMWLLKR